MNPLKHACMHGSYDPQNQSCWRSEIIVPDICGEKKENDIWVRAAGCILLNKVLKVCTRVKTGQHFFLAVVAGVIRCMYGKSERGKFACNK